eukprot:Gb_25530 [translate_table: standard]
MAARRRAPNTSIIIWKRWNETYLHFHKVDPKQTYYLSMEYLQGSDWKFCRKNIYNMQKKNITKVLCPRTSCYGISDSGWRSSVSNGLPEIHSGTRETNADITVAAWPMDEKRATTFGLMKIDSERCIVEIAEKPKGEQLKAMSVDSTILGLDEERAKEMPYIASMAIYVVSKDAMLNLLCEKFLEENDFGSEVIPGATSIRMGVQAYLYDGYWEDIGSIEAFYNANLGIMKKPIPNCSFYDRSSPIYTQSRFLPPSKMLDADVTNSVIGEGSVIKNCKIHHSGIGLRSWISEGAIIEDSLLMGVDYYETNEEGLLMSLAGGECPACRDIVNYCGFTPISHKHYKSASVMSRLHQ